MRRKNKHIVKGALIGSTALVVTDLVFQWRELGKEGKKLNWENYDGCRAFKWGLVGAAGGAVLGELLYDYKIYTERSLPFNADSYLKNILTEESIKSDPTLLKKVLNTREKVKTWLRLEFGHLLAGPFEDTGSFPKRTAIGSKFDLDIILPFSKNSFSSLEDMFNFVYTKVHTKYSNVAEISKNKKSICITFSNGVYDISFDIVPGREINNYSKDKQLNLYKNPAYFWQTGGAFKTNVSIQKNMTVNKPQERKILKLLKAYRDRNNLLLPTLILEQLTVDAFQKYNLYSNYSLSTNFLYIIKYISNKLRNTTLIDIANTNNNILEKMNSYERNVIADQLWDDAECVQNNPRYLMEIFE